LSRSNEVDRDVTASSELSASTARLEGALIEAQRRAETLAEREAWYRGLVENSNDAIGTFDMAGAVTSVNHAFEALFGWSREELLGRPWRDLVAPDDLPAMEERTRRGFAGEKLPSIFEVRGRHKTGTVFALEARTHIMRDGQGNPRAFRRPAVTSGSASESRPPCAPARSTTGASATARATSSPPSASTASSRASTAPSPP
jgi:PAS domain S-box-containing protein